MKHQSATLFLALVLAGAVAAQEKPGIYTQDPVIAKSTENPNEPEPATPTKPADKLQGGPAPVWIWGADANRRYFLRKEFEGGAKSATVKASCDNVMTLYLNGKEIAGSDSWQTPIEKGVQNALQQGKNVLLAEVANEGGPSGFALKLGMTMADGKAQYVVSDNTWQAATSKDATEWKPVRTLGKMGAAPWGDVFAQAGTDLASSQRGVFSLLPGFQVELLYTVPKGELGSWVCITTDDKGRLLVSDQENKGICRVTPPPVGGKGPTRVEKLDLKMSAAQGMLHAFGSLYFCVNGGPGSGLYRARDTNGDDQYDELVKLKSLQGGGEHGPHALRLSPDGKSIYVIAGNHTRPPEGYSNNPVMTNWGEDLLLPRQWDANGHARGILAPGGWIARTDPDGKTWDLFSIGYRNQYDMDFNADGELFAYDADMEWDMGTPWYRPTRVTHATSGSEFGWRSGTGKWPSHYVDSLPQLIDIGPGSPVGVQFGYGARFPAKYQKALYICDWTFGTMYAIHIEPDGASYKAVKEEFLSRTPLPLTDVTVGKDGALYFTIGGRGTQSELYRATYVGKEPTTPVEAKDGRFAELRALRHKLEQHHKRSDNPDEALKFIWPNLAHADRHIRYAARVALEHQDVKGWQERALAEKDPQTLITAAVALARQGDKALQPRLLAALDRLDLGTLSEGHKLDLLRVWSLVFIRMGEPSPEAAGALAAKLNSHYPAASDDLNRELCNVLVYLKSPPVIGKTIALMKEKREVKPEEMAELLARNRGYGGTIANILANLPEIQNLHYAFALRNMREGWTVEQRKFYYQWLQDARRKSGGASYQGFIKNIENEAWDNTSEVERIAVEGARIRQPYQIKAVPKPTGPGRLRSLDDILALAKTGLKGRNFENGKKMYAATRCIVCHRFDGDGGATGPDLTQLAGRFNLKDLTEAIVEPSKVISDQYRGTVIETSKGLQLTGRVIAETPDTVTILTDPEDSTKVVEVKKSEIEDKRPIPISLMPNDLLQPLNDNEVLDLLAYLLSRGNPRDAMFRR
jgi:putative heme-binding domain-containing protein